MSLDDEVFLLFSKKFNIFLGLIFILIGLIGNILLLIVLIQKKFRKNSSHVYLLCLCINDNLFLIVQFFEDIVRTFKDVYPELTYSFSFKFLNLVNENNFTCRLMNFLRNSLRTFSVYILVLFMIQHLMLISDKLNTKKRAWKNSLVVMLISLAVNMWVPFIFKINIDESNNTYCDVYIEHKFEYFVLNSVHIVLIIFLPIIIYTICLFLLITKRIKNKKNKYNKYNIDTTDVKQRGNVIELDELTENDSVILRRFQPFIVTLKHIRVTKRIEINKSKQKITRILILLSFSFIVSNLPYLVAWLFFYFSNPADSFWFGILQISEVFNVINYSLKFVFYSLSESNFRKQIKYTIGYFRKFYNLFIFKIYYFIFLKVYVAKEKLKIFKIFINLILLLLINDFKK